MSDRTHYADGFTPAPTCYKSASAGTFLAMASELLADLIGGWRLGLHTCSGLGLLQ